MADQGKSDILMQFVLDSGPVSAECAAQKETTDDFMTTFNPISDAADYSDFFQVLKFDFGFAVKDADASKNKKGNDKHGSQADPKTQSKGKSSFASWRSAKKGEIEKVTYPLEFEEFNFTRLIDAASPIFFQSCCNNITFPTVILVRRLSVDQYKMPMSFLRLTFSNVLLTGVDWDDGDVLNETCKFVCQSLTIDYKQQDADGNLNSAGQQPKWDWQKDSNATKDQ